MITATGIGSGLDVEGLVTQLLAVEAQPVNARLDRREGKLQAELSAIGTLRSALATFQSRVGALADPAQFRGSSVNLSAEDYLSVTASSDATPGEYTVEVSRLASAQRLASEAFFAADESVGTGEITIRFGSYDATGNTFTPNPDKSDQSLTIDASNSSLSGLRDAINDADLGLRANVINDGTGFRLLVSAEDTGESNGVQILVADDDGIDADGFGLSRLAFDPTATVGSGRNLTETVAPQDAALKIDGLDVTAADNKLDSVLEGVAIELLAESDGDSVQLSIEPDLGKTREAVRSFVDAYNEASVTLGSLTRVDVDSGARGPLVGDPAARGIEFQLRKMINTSVTGLDGSDMSLATLGVTTSREGSLVLDESVLNDVIESDPDQVAALFARLGAASDALVDVEKLPEGVPAGNHAVSVTQAATRGEYSGGTLSALLVDGNNDELSLAVDGVTSGAIRLTQALYASGEDLAAEIARQVNADGALREAGVGATVGYETGSLVIRSNTYGSASYVNVLTADPQAAATLGIAPGAGAAGVDVAGTIGGIEATGAGQVLSGTGRYVGMDLIIAGTTLGSRGNVYVSDGIADRLDALIEGFLSAEGTIGARQDGLDDRLEDVDEQRERLTARLDRLETSLRAQFGALDSLVAELSATGTFLNQQLANLPGFTRDPQ